ncbi:type VII secretion-associated serine protease [Streptomyces humidus]|uniref:Type VII secretion-associated serine protease n=1 Tax=Streptomyces humidus TaxID=52259 RepID=A0A918FU16_9ACTN|nr:S8 family serine peptidase [Streptomyces humidus]GGR83652.1 type VII secretion-associated serine protease [Streptomyces humidus]
MPLSRPRRAARPALPARRSRYVLPSGLWALALTVCSVPAASAGDAEPSPAASAPTVRLPVIPGSLGSGASCTRPSPTAMTVVPWTYAVLGLSGAREHSRGAGVTVAVVDTGVEPGTRGLKGRVEAVGDAGEDCVGHGSFVAGLIAADDRTSGGAGAGGMAPDARVLAVRGTDARGRADAAAVAVGIRAAADARAGVIAVPLALSKSSEDLTAAVRYATAQDCLVVAAAVPDAPAGASHGTTTPAPPGAYWPASDKGVLSVLDFGPDGDRPDDAPKPLRADLAAPGDKVVGAGPRGKGSFTGTGASFATAYVAGAAALVRSRYPKLSAEETARRLTGTAYPADTPRLDTYASLTVVPHTGRAAVSQGAPERRVVLSLRADDPGPRRIALLVGSAGLLAVLTAAAVRGAVRARRVRPDDVAEA